MIKKISSFVLCIAMTMTMFCHTAAASKTYEIHVSPSGSDTGGGTVTSPLRTFKAAKSKVEEVKKKFGLNSAVNVIFHEGEYFFDDEPINFEEKDAGRENAYVTYMGAPGETVKFIGSKKIDISKIKKVEDKEILDRLPERSRDMVGYIDLKEQGITREMITDIENDMTSKPETAVFLNGEKQTNACWPNPRYDYNEYTIVSQGSNTAGNGAIIGYSESNPLKWLNAKDIIIEGYFNGQDYASQRYKVQSIDTSKKEINLAVGSATSSVSRRWRVTNLLEELDIPGEWYIDRDTMILYYYPQVSLKDADMDMTVKKTMFFKLKNCSYIRFKNITFTESAGGVIDAQNSDGVQFIDCTFRSIGATSAGQGNAVISAYGTYTYAVNDYNSMQMADHTNTWWLWNKDGPEKWLIEGCLFSDLTYGAVYFQGGDKYNMIKGENVVRNCYITRAGQQNPGGTQVIALGGMGDIAEHNLVHNIPFHAINTSCSENKIMYNELINTLRDTQDAGAIYGGRTIVMRGDEVAYNFIKDYLATTKRVTPHNRAIYYDDEACEMNIHHNIAVDGDKAITVSGSSAVVKNNLAVNSISSWHMKGYGASWRDSQEKKYYNWEHAIERGTTPEHKARWAAAYPALDKELEYYKKTGEMEFLFNDIEDNVSVNSPTDDGLKEYTESRQGTFLNNEWIDSFDGFVDAENNDYRIKKDSDLYKRHPNLISEDFDWNLIGIQLEKFDKTKVMGDNRNFRLVYPQNGVGGIPTTDVTFEWTNALGVDTYHFVLAKDREFKNIVEESDVYCNKYTVANLEAGCTNYYWTVTAKNETVKFKGEWKPDSVVYSFSTTKENTITLDDLIDKYTTTSAKVSSVVEGTTPGTYKVGTIANVNEQLKNALAVIEKNGKGMNQKDINNVSSLLDDSLATSRMNTGFIDLKDYLLEKANWKDLYTNSFTIENGEVVVSGKKDDGSNRDGQITLTPIKDMSKSVFFCFKMKMDLKEAGGGYWVGMGVRGEPEKIIYGQYNYFCVIKDDLLEFQIRSSGLTGIIETLENNGIIKNGVWHDVVFGAFDCDFAQLTLLVVDGKTLFNYMDYTQHQLKFTGGLTFYSTKDNKLSIKATDTMPTDFEQFVDTAIHKAYKQIGQEIIDYNTNDTTAAVMVNGYKKYYYNGEERDAAEAPYIAGANKYFIPASTMIALYGDKGAAITDINGVKMISNAEVARAYNMTVYNSGETLYISHINDFYTGDASIPYKFNTFAAATKKITK